MKVTILGCGGSGGVPLITGDWGHCNPNNPKNRRRRVSVLVEQGDTRILIDTSPDLRAQFLDAGVTKLDAVLYTHGVLDGIGQAELTQHRMHIVALGRRLRMRDVDRKSTRLNSSH